MFLGIAAGAFYLTRTLTVVPAAVTMYAPGAIGWEPSPVPRHKVLPSAECMATKLSPALVTTMLPPLTVMESAGAATACMPDLETVIDAWAEAADSFSVTVVTW